MNLQDLRDACVYSAMVPSERRISLTAAKGSWPKGFPRGELLNEMVRNGVTEQTKSFTTTRIMAWVKRHDLLRS